ncbi:MAG TPA: ferritin family protein [Candidatus Acidoferrum sp.]|nr:ferritin family protein [Candidatus Acidoferrum sp.]
MLSTIPINIDGISKENIDKEILRVGIIAEYDAINLYEQMAALADNENVKATLLDIAKEEKTHVGEFQAILMRLDDEFERELEKGKLEANELK